MSGELPNLLDCKRLCEELGNVPRGVAEALMRDLDKVRIGRRVFVKRDDVQRAISAATVNQAGFRKETAA